MRGEVGAVERKEQSAIPASVPRALHRFYQKGKT